MEGLGAQTGLPPPKVRLNQKERRDLALFFLYSLQIAQLRDRVQV